MHTYAKLKNNDVMVVYSDNQLEETYHCYSLDLDGLFDATVDSTTKISYSDVLCVDCNLSYIKNY